MFYDFLCSMSLYGGIGTEVAKAVVFSLISDKSEDEKNKDVIAISECVLGKNYAKLNVSNKELFIVTLAGLKYAYEVRTFILISICFWN